MNQATKRSFRLKVVAGVLTALHAVLPKQVYDHVYLFAFPRYKALLRWRYRSQALRRNGADRKKIEAVFKCLEFSLVGWQGLEVTYDCARRAISEGVSGALVECGVAQGGSALLLALVNREFGFDQRMLWLFDSYQGLPDPTKDDYEGDKTGTHVRPLPKGSCLGTYEEVSRLLFVHNQISRQAISMVKGWFQDTLPVTRAKIGPIAVLRLDGDWYESTKVCFENLFDQVSNNGFVILDDYFSCFGCKKATDEFLAAREKAYPIIPDGRGGAYFQVRN
jgi:hypothetical protein